MNRLRFGIATIILSLLAACASTPPPQPTPIAPSFDPASMIAAIDQAGVADSRELVVNPLTAARIAGLDQDAGNLRAPGSLSETAVILDNALETSPDDPSLLQVRAENAILQGDLPAAERFARRAAAAGTQAGPQCRRHWETIVQVLKVAAVDDDAFVSARASRDACTVAAPPRY